MLVAFTKPFRKGTGMNLKSVLVMAAVAVAVAVGYDQYKARKNG